MRKKISTEKAPQATGSFSQGILTEDFVFTSGQIPLTTQGKLLEGSLEQQINQIMQNLKGILGDVGLSFEHVVKTTIYVTDMEMYKTVNDVYGSYMIEPFPAREVICVKALPLGAQIEISMVAKRT